MDDLEQQDYVRVRVVQNLFEAQQAEALLKEAKIDCMVVSFHDTALNGIYQPTRGWGEIKVGESRKQEAESLLAQGLKDLGGMSDDEVEAQALKETLHDDGPAEEGSASQRMWWVIGVMLALLVVLWTLKKFT